MNEKLSYLKMEKKSPKHFILIFIFTCLSATALSQNSRSDFASSRIYLKGTFIEEKNELTGLQTKRDLSDTLIDNILFKKFETADFIDYAANKEMNIYYESFSTTFYLLLDNNKKIIHKINYVTEEDQTATLFGKEASVALSFVDTRSSYPRDSLKATEKTPRKYYQKENPEVYLIIIPDLKSVAVSANKGFYSKLLMGDNYNEITKGLQNNFKVSTKFDIEKEDEIQLFYRRKWYNDSSNFAEYEDKQFKNFKYLGDTIVNNNRALKMEVSGYNYLSGSQDNAEIFLINVTDSGYYLGYQFIPFKDFETELKIVDNNNTKELFLQGINTDSANGFSYQKIIQVKSDPYRYFILPFFPMPFIEFGNVEGIITYTKLKGIESGKKRERTYITAENNIRDILNPAKNKVEVIMYFTEAAEVVIEIKDEENDKILGQSKSNAVKGLNSFTVPVKNFEKDKLYRVQINLRNKKGSGSFSDSIKSKY